MIHLDQGVKKSTKTRLKMLETIRLGVFWFFILKKSFFWKLYKIHLIKSQITSSTNRKPGFLSKPDYERMEWFNIILRQLWPFLTSFVKRVIREQVRFYTLSHNSRKCRSNQKFRRKFPNWTYNSLLLSWENSNRDWLLSKLTKTKTEMTEASFTLTFR